VHPDHSLTRPRPTSSGVRLLVGLLALVLCAGLSTLPVGSSEAASRVRVTRTVDAGTVLAGDRATVRGRVTPAARGTRVSLQRLVGKRWRSVKSTRLTARSTYAFSLATRRAATARYRVLAPARAGRRAATSPAFGLRVLACTPSAAPSRGAAAWFGGPWVRSTSPISRQLARLFCAAAPGSTVDISMYFVRAVLDRSDVGAILVPLQRVARYRGVRVHFMLEGRLYGRGAAFASSTRILRRIGTVTFCNAGCRNERPAGTRGEGILHHKFITISDMSWRRGADPAVVVSSANWSQSQLHNFWQSALLLYDDQALFRQFDVQWNTMAACSRGCASWAARLSRLSLAPRTYGLTNSNGVWNDAVPVERLGGSTTGRGVTFSPWPGVDPMAAALRSYRCVPGHRTIRVGHMFITSGRQSIIDALAALRARGCRVQVILRQLPGKTQLQAAIKLMARARLPLGCLDRMHNKIVLIDAVRVSDGRPDLAMWMGSQSLGLSALRTNDESLLRTSSAAASGPDRIANQRMYLAFNANWEQMARVQKRCV
jgi:hypothetical protein